MAQSRNFFEDVKKELECSVCQEQFSEINEPKILKCLHTFCKNCLEAWLRQQREGELKCPTCRHITECPNSDINRLPSNLFYKQMVEIVEAYNGQGQEDSPHCGNCEEKKSLKFYCSDCNCFLCDECAGTHKKWKCFRGHHIKEIGNFDSSDVQDYARKANICKKHRDELRYFCDKCKICICRDCAILDHQDHNKVSFEQGLEKKKSDITNKMEEVEAVGRRLENHKESLEKRRTRVEYSIDQATNEVHRVAEHCISLIRQHEATMTKELLERKASYRAELSAQMTDLDGKLVEIHSGLEFGKDVVERNNLPEILNVEELLERRFQELLSSPKFNPAAMNHSEVKYVPVDMASIQNGLGKLFITKTEPSLSIAQGKGLTEGTQGEDCTFTIITKDSQGQTTYSEIDQVIVDIQSLQTGRVTKPSITDSKDGCYQVKYKPEDAGEFNVSITIWGEAIMGSSFQMKVKERASKGRGKDGDSNSRKARRDLGNRSRDAHKDDETQQEEAHKLLQFLIRTKGGKESVYHGVDTAKSQENSSRGLDELSGVTSTVTEPSSFEVQPQFMNLLKRVRKTDLQGIEENFGVVIVWDEDASQVRINPRRMSNEKNRFQEGCCAFIDLYQKFHPNIGREVVELTNEANDALVLEAVSFVQSKTPVIVENVENNLVVYAEKAVISSSVHALKEKLGVTKNSGSRKTRRGQGNKSRDSHEDNEALQQGRFSLPRHLNQVLKNGVSLSLYQGDITDERVDAIVNAANEWLQHGAGVAGAIVSKGGYEIQDESNWITNRQGPLNVGEAVYTSGGILPCRYVIHTVGPRWREHGRQKSISLLHQACMKSLRLAVQLELSSIALTAISSGIFGMPKDICAQVMFKAVEEFSSSIDAEFSVLRDVRIVSIDQLTINVFHEEFVKRYHFQEKLPETVTN